MNIYVSGAAGDGDGRTRGHLKEVLLKDGHLVATWEELSEKYGPVGEEGNIKCAMSFINNNAIDLLILTGDGWRNDKKCLVETFCARSSMARVVEFRDRRLVPVEERGQQE